MYQDGVERKVRDKLCKWFGRGKIAQILSVAPDSWMALLTDGGVAYATVEEDGSITIQEREVVC